MRRKIIIIIVVMLIFWGCTMLIVKNNDNEKREMFSAPVKNNELLVCSEEGFNSIKVYRKENQIVVNAESESAFFEGTQFSVGTSGEITPENVEIIWMTIGGGTEQVEDNDRIIAEIKITDNGELICDTKINFAKKAFEAVEDVLEQIAQ
jgi:hypothetical protein